MKPHPAVVVNASVMSTVSAVLPGFLIGALSVQVSAEMGVSEAAYGWGLGSFFGAATVGSILLGRLAQRIGALNQMTLALIVTAIMQLTLAIAAKSFIAVVACLVGAGLANAANQTSVNLALAQAQLPRLGLAMSIKQSGMPSSTLLAGLAVPSLAVTVGWRWAYVSSAMLALVSLWVVRTAVGRVVPQKVPAAFPGSSAVLRPVSSSRDLFWGAAVGGFLAFSAGALNAWGVASGVDAGLAEGTAGLCLSLGAAICISLRLLGGWWSDTMRAAPFTVAGISVLIGSVGMAALAFRTPGLHVLAMLVAVGGGWVWPVFTNFGIVRTNAAAAGSATGITQMGVYVGVFVAPLVTGWLIETAGYQLMWLSVAGAAIVGGIIAIRVAKQF